MSDIGIICQGGLYNAVIRALQTLGLADAFGASQGADLLHERDLPAGAGGDHCVLRRQDARC